jgi:hypothetical protein
MGKFKDWLKNITKMPNIGYENLNKGYFYPIQTIEYTEIPFSCDPQVYFEILSKYMLIERDQEICIKFIQEFIDSCLVMGKAQDFFNSMNIKIFDICCHSKIYLGRNPSGGYNEYNSYAINIETHTDEKVLLESKLHNNKRWDASIEIFLKTDTLPHQDTPDFYIRRGPHGTLYIESKKFTPPKFRDLPRYINVPYLRTYVKNMFEKGPPKIEPIQQKIIF